MATLSDTRDTALNICNEVRRKLGIPTAASFTADDHMRVMLDYLNDVVSYISDNPDWLENLRETEFTCQSSVRDYVVETSAVVKNIKELVFDNSISPLQLVDIDKMRQHVRTSATGEPDFWTVIRIDATTGNPVVRVSPEPVTAEAGKMFSVLWHERPRRLTTSDTSYLVPFDSRLVTQMLLALMRLDESGGASTQQVQNTLAFFDTQLYEAHNRLTADSGHNVQFTFRRG